MRLVILAITFLWCIGLRAEDEARAFVYHVVSVLEGAIDWKKTARQLSNRVRGLQPWPNAYTMLNGQQLTIFRAEVLNEPTDAAPGTIVHVTRAIHVATGDRRQLCLTKVQRAGGKRMSSQEFLRGHRVNVGARCS